MNSATPTLLDHRGNPISSRKEAAEEVRNLRQQIYSMIRAKYDAAHTGIGNENHWLQADQLDPNAANSLAVRKKLRSRSRYEVIENNCYLKGMLLMFANDFVGRGPRLQVTDRRIPKDRRRFIEKRWLTRAKLIKLRQKLWRLVIAKKGDGEGCGVAFDNSRLKHPVKLDWNIIETDQISHPYGEPISPQKREIDGIRFDKVMQPEAYSILRQHPGSNFLWTITAKQEADWIKEKYVINWFRRDRGWLRGIPETTPSLPLCAILRRYTLAVLRAAEFAADVAGVLESDGPVGGEFWQAFESLGAAIGGDSFPTEHGMFVTTPWGYKLKQIDAKHPMQVYDVFVNAILREIARPILIPYVRAVGSSQESNMASAVVDEQVYKAATWSERYDCEDEVLDKDLSLWWTEGIRTEGYFSEPIRNEATGRVSDDFTELLTLYPSLKVEPPEHNYRWDQVGIAHTDPSKVANAMGAEWDRGFQTDQDIQEEFFNRDYEDWVEQMQECLQIRRDMGLPVPAQSTNFRAITQEEIPPSPDDPNPKTPKPPVAPPSKNGNGKPSKPRR